MNFFLLLNAEFRGSITLGTQVIFHRYLSSLLMAHTLSL